MALHVFSGSQPVDVLLLSDMLGYLQVLLQELLVAAGAPAASGLPDVKRLACMHGLLQELLQHAAFGGLQVGQQRPVRTAASAQFVLQCGKE